MCDYADSSKPTDGIPLWFPQTCFSFLQMALSEWTRPQHHAERKSLLLCEWGEWTELGTSTSEGENTGWTCVEQRWRQMEMVLRGTRQIDGSRDSRIFRLRYQNVMKLYTNVTVCNCIQFFSLLIGLCCQLCQSFPWGKSPTFGEKHLFSLIIAGLRFGNFGFYYYIYILFYCCGTSSLRWKDWALLENEPVRTALFYTWAAFQKQPFPHLLSPQRVYLYSRPPPKLSDNSGNLLNQNKVYL